MQLHQREAVQKKKKKKKKLKTKCPRVLEDVPLVEFIYLVFIRMPGESYRRRLMFLL